MKFFQTESEFDLNLPSHEIKNFDSINNQFISNGQHKTRLDI